MPYSDYFPNIDTVTAPGKRMFEITPHDDNEVDPLPKALRFDGAGAVTLRAVDSDADVTINVAAGSELHVRVRYVRDTGTDAITIHGIA